MRTKSVSMAEFSREEVRGRVQAAGFSPLILVFFVSGDAVGRSRPWIALAEVTPEPKNGFWRHGTRLCCLCQSRTALLESESFARSCL